MELFPLDPGYAEGTEQIFFGKLIDKPPARTANNITQ
jgi:hypothetical protein